MTADQLLKRLAKECKIPRGLKRKVRSRVLERMGGIGDIFDELKEGIEVDRTVRQDIWSRIETRTQPHDEVLSTLDHLKGLLKPSTSTARTVRQNVFARLQPAAQAALRPLVLKWAAAFAILGLMVRVSPLVFLATPTTAESRAVLFPTVGAVAVSGITDLVSQELALSEGMLLRTREGDEASIILYDDAVIRMDQNTIIELHDLTRRVEPAPDHMPTLTLHTGRLWLDGLGSSRIRGVTVATKHGLVTVKEGSVSITEDKYVDTVDIEVYDHSATVVKGAEEIVLVAGERMQLNEAGVPLVKKLADYKFTQHWAHQNLTRDAVHREGIAELQRQRQIEMAGILPTSPFYPMKRMAETVDVLLTFGEDARAQKEVLNAEKRVYEAAALLAQGQDITAPLEEYRGTLLALAGAEDDGSFIQFLVRQSVNEQSASVAAIRPGDKSYLLKKAILEASTELPEAVVREEDVYGELLVDALIALTRTVEAGDVSTARSIWVDLQPSLAAFHDEDLTMRPAIYREIQNLLTFFAVAISEVGRDIAGIDPELMSDIVAYLPPPLEPEPPILAEEEVMRIVQGIRDKIFVYHLRRSRLNQFIVEMKAIEGHPEQGRILRRLAKSLPEGPESFPQRVQKEIVQVRWERVLAEQVL